MQNGNEEKKQSRKKQVRVSQRVIFQQSSSFSVLSGTVFLAWLTEHTELNKQGTVGSKSATNIQHPVDTYHIVLQEKVYVRTSFIGYTKKKKRRKKVIYESLFVHALTGLRYLFSHCVPLDKDSAHFITPCPT